MTLRIPIRPQRLAQLLPPVLAVGLSACRTNAPRAFATPVIPGMTAGAVAMTFGRPVRIQINPDGSEDWYYAFSLQRRESAPIAETVSVVEPVEAPIRLSRAGRVIEPIPTGDVAAK